MSCSADLSTPLALIQYCGWRLAGPGDPARAHVAVAQAADAVEQLDVAQVAVGEDLLDRERGGQEVERVEPLARRGVIWRGDVVAVARARRRGRW